MQHKTPFLLGTVAHAARSARAAWAASLTATGAFAAAALSACSNPGLRPEAAPKWSFVAPEAVLRDAGGVGAEVGTHGAGPHWLWSDGSKVTGKVEARADAPAAGNIPWLLLKATPGGVAGRLAQVTYVQRVNTAGGVAPADGCASKADAGRQVRVPYTSDYRFFVHAG
jgi:Protein of unknown function (DUF3455)